MSDARRPTAAAALIGARRLVVKIGSALVVAGDGTIRRSWLDSLIEDVVRCRTRGQDIVIVSSGAIAIGRTHLG
ncbi:MAG: glutamate 5-kinase, partial [Stellaceae bacterium]